jgi:hypothetical protein
MVEIKYERENNMFDWICTEVQNSTNSNVKPMWFDGKLQDHV